MSGHRSKALEVMNFYRSHYDFYRDGMGVETNEGRLGVGGAEDMDAFCSAGFYVPKNTGKDKV